MPVMGSLPMAATSSLRERRQLLGDQKGIAAAAHVKHPVLVQVEFGLEAVVAAQDLHREPRRHDLGDGSRSEGLIGVLGDQLVALLVNHEHDPRWSERRDLLLDAGERRGGQQEQGAGEGEGEQARPHGNSGRCYLQAQGRNRQTAFIYCVGRGQAPKLTPGCLTCRIIAESRPFEGAQFAVFAAQFWGYFQLRGNRTGVRLLPARQFAAAAIAIVLIAGGCFGVPSAALAAKHQAKAQHNTNPKPKLQSPPAKTSLGLPCSPRQWPHGRARRCAWSSPRRSLSTASFR